MMTSRHQSRSLTSVVIYSLVVVTCLAAVTVGDVCYRKYDPHRGACKGRLVGRETTEHTACCSKRGKGYAVKVVKFAGTKKWYECTPCTSPDKQDGEVSRVVSPAESVHSVQLGDDRGESDLTRWLSSNQLEDDTVELRQHLDEQRKKSTADRELDQLVTSSITVVDNVTSVESVWSPWSDWGPCSGTCDSGIQQRTRFCLAVTCTGEDYEEKPCTGLVLCPVDGGWAEWAEWQPCSVTCEVGTQVRYRSCSNPAPVHGGDDCSGTNIDRQNCTSPTCPVDGGWSNYSDWSECNVTCGIGWRRRARICDSPQPTNGGKECEGLQAETSECVNLPCPVDGGWSEWDNWTQCSVQCGEGFQTRSRTCTHPTPLHGGKACEGLELESTPCINRTNCNVNGNWSEWSRWDTCNARPCSGLPGFRTRYRSCTNPRPMFGGKPCRGRTWTSELCYNNDFCSQKVDGHWCNWSVWSECNKDIKRRTRVCQCPPPANGGTVCEGGANEEETCGTAGVQQFTATTQRKFVLRNDCDGDASGDGSDVSCDQESEENVNSDLHSSGEGL